MDRKLIGIDKENPQTVFGFTSQVREYAKLNVFEGLSLLRFVFLPCKYLEYLLKCQTNSIIINIYYHVRQNTPMKCSQMAFVAFPERSRIVRAERSTHTRHSAGTRQSLFRRKFYETHFSA